MAGPGFDDNLRPGKVLGPYELAVPVGAGGMANVWAARVRGLPQQVVALKMLLPDLAKNESFREMFFDEARIASRVRHPNVCATYDFATHDGVLLLAMEWVDGASLMRLLRPGSGDDERGTKIPIPPRYGARIVADACAGLHAAHELVGDDGNPLGVVHRDVSPHNVLLTKAGAVKVTDFGVAKALGKSHMTIAGQLKGKLAYMSAEQLSGDPVDRRADVFALGCVLYEATTGEQPFQGESDPQVMARIMMGQFEPPSTIVPGYPRELEEILARAMDPTPAARFATAEHLRVALERFLRASGPPIEPRHVAELLHQRCGAEIAARDHALHASDSGAGGAMALDRRPAARPPRGDLLLFASAVLLGAGLGLGALAWVRSGRQPKPPREVVLPATQTAGPWSTSAHAEPPPATVSAAPGADTAAIEGRGDVEPPSPDAIDVDRAPPLPSSPKKEPPAGPVPAPAPSAAPSGLPEMPPNPY